MKFLADENVYKITIDFLRENNFNIMSAKELKLCRCKDEYIIEYALQNNFVLISNDKDFSNILRFPPYKYLGIIVLRISKRTLNEVHNNFLTFLNTIDRKKIIGSLTVIDKNKFRIRS